MQGILHIKIFELQKHTQKSMTFIFSKNNKLDCFPLECFWRRTSSVEWAVPWRTTTTNKSTRRYFKWTAVHHESVLRRKETDSTWKVWIDENAKRNYTENYWWQKFNDESKYFNPFVPNVPFLYPLKTPKGFLFRKGRCLVE